MYGELIPYQIGDPRDGMHHVFTKAELSSSLPMPLKSNIANYPIGHGNVDLKLDRPDYFDDWVVDIQFMIYDKEAAACNGLDYNNHDICRVRQIIHSYPCKVFPIFFKKMGMDGNFTWVVNYVHPTADGMPEQEFSSNDDRGGEIENYSMRLRFVRPYLYAICDDDLRCVDNTDFLNTEFALQPDECLDPSECIKSHYDLSRPMSELSREEIDQFCSCNGDGKAMIWFDRFFKKETCEINRDLDFQDFTISTPDSVSVQNEVITAFDFASNGYNYVYQIQFEPLLPGQSFTVSNNNSSLRISWTGSQPNANPIIYNSFDSTFYDAVTCETIRQINYTSAGSAQPLLYFANQGVKNADNISFTKNITGDFDLTIKFYKTFLT